jgi:5-methylcytosine-specific restriction enzyme A
VECEKTGRIEAANVVDHIIPHRGDMELFWDADNWQSLCRAHHDAKTRRGQ